jgi:hypothetical protein
MFLDFSGCFGFEVQKAENGGLLNALALSLNELVEVSFSEGLLGVGVEMGRGLLVGGEFKRPKWGNSYLLRGGLGGL